MCMNLGIIIKNNGNMDVGVLKLCLFWKIIDSIIEESFVISILFPLHFE